MVRIVWIVAVLAVVAGAYVAFTRGDPDLAQPLLVLALMCAAVLLLARTRRRP